MKGFGCILDYIYIRSKKERTCVRQKKTLVLYSDVFPEHQSLMSSFTLVSGLNNSNGAKHSALLKLTPHKGNVCNKKMNPGTHQGHGWRYTGLSVYAYELWHLEKNWPSSSCSFVFL